MFYAGESNVPGAAGNLLAGGNVNWQINRSPGALGGRSGEQLKRLYEGGTQQNQQLNDELMRRGIMPGGPQLPLAYQQYGGQVPMGNAGFFAGPQLGQTIPMGFQNKYVS
jgi:hypothetical protein